MSPRMSAEERKEDMVKLAMPLFAKKGLKAATTKELAEACGVSEALLYKHFPSKEKLYERIKDYCCVESRARANELAALPSNTQTLILSIFALTAFIYEGTIDGPDRAELTKRLMLRSLMEEGEFARDFLEANFIPYIPKVKEGFEAAEKSGDLVSMDITLENRIWMVHHMVMGAAAFALPKKPVVDYKANTEELTDQIALMVLRGVGISDEAIQTHYHPQTLRAFLIGATQG